MDVKETVSIDGGQLLTHVPVVTRQTFPIWFTSSSHNGTLYPSNLITPSEPQAGKSGKCT